MLPEPSWSPPILGLQIQVTAELGEPIHLDCTYSLTSKMRFRTQEPVSLGEGE